MDRSPTTLRPHLYLPLKQLALCLDCEKCFELGVSACPACGSGTVVALAQFLDAGGPTTGLVDTRAKRAA
jgi:hypothetical protein